MDPQRDECTYEPLPVNSIRLIGLGETGDSSATLKTINLDDAPPYFALSYAWGTQATDILMEINGQVIHVSSVLGDAIQCLQEVKMDEPEPEDRVKWVWIDKICINQDDFAERSHQVKMMNSIYSRAIRTLIWLGPDLDICSGAWQLIDQIYGVFRDENPTAKFAADLPFELYSDQSHAASGLPGWDHHMWRHLRKLLKLPWFTRTWIVQEVALSRKDPVLLHGRHKYPWHRLGWVSTWLRRRGYLRLPQIPNEMQNVDTISSIRRSGVPWRLDALLIATSQKCHASDQRDKIYGLLGLAAESQDPSCISGTLQPDYKLEVAEVYAKVALFILREYKSLSVLTRASGVARESDQVWAQNKQQPNLLPTWTPNWCDYPGVKKDVVRSLSWLLQPDTGGAEVLGFPEHYNASAGLPVRLFESSRPFALRLSGLRVDTVVSSTLFDDEQQSFGQNAPDPPLLMFWKTALPFWSEGEKTLTDCVTSWIKATTAEQHRLAGRTAEQMMKDGSAYLHNYLSSTDHIQSCAPHEPGGNGPLCELSMGGDPEAYTALARNFCVNRSFFVTQEGRMGIGPSGTQVGDLAFVLFGGGVPYILRTSGCSFCFVGESYVHGLMGGEAVRAWERGELVEETLELR
ncbi:unnamed protein product [Clonostachys rhizophaga]|uniref:Heterokaryon incompatibility domain-containing protein n=1 Tax=Clonostachys rhizophaga TaxID=160324 RepID=A0A9N9VVA4_9HYPO|nr:unnamed protein product [Clonostachys rhizophaga]